jgi:hypothetical protein
VDDFGRVARPSFLDCCLTVVVVAVGDVLVVVFSTTGAAVVVTGGGVAVSVEDFGGETRMAMVVREQGGEEITCKESFGSKPTGVH